MRRKLAAGNWKMNGAGEALAEIDALIAAHPDPDCGILICPPATLIHRIAERARGSWIRVGGQTCHPEASGAHTGDIAAEMLAEAGASHVITGHSERRADHGERDEDVRRQAEAALRAGLVPVICVGETLAEREAGNARAVVGAQLAGSVPDDPGIVIAYEPVWAIGTGKVPSPDDIGAIHAAIRADLAARFGSAAGAIPLLYGGSVKAANAAEIFGIADVDGALVGGASLSARDFSPIVAALEAAASR